MSIKLCINLPQGGFCSSGNIYGVIFAVVQSRLRSKIYSPSTVKLGDKERFDKEQIEDKEPFPMTNFQFTS